MKTAFTQAGSSYFCIMDKKNQKAAEKIQKKAGKAIHEYKMIKQNDHVLVALSGGVDSLVLLDILSKRKEIIPINFQLSAIHVTHEINSQKISTNVPKIKEFCRARNIPLHIFDLKLELDDKAMKKGVCFLCSWNRRKMIFEKARELGCNKIAFGHHMDDALETLLMNMCFHGEISSIPPIIQMFRGIFTIIRPMTLLTAKEITKYSQISSIQNAEGNCPYEEKNQREEFRPIVEKMSQMHKLGKVNLYNSMSNILNDYLPNRKY
jgi:tRNA(Ile)-lysidine synthetase-like protein